MIKNFNQPNSQISFCGCIGDFGTWAIKFDQKATQQEFESLKLLVPNEALLQQRFSTKTVTSTYGSWLIAETSFQTQETHLHNQQYAVRQLY